MTTTSRSSARRLATVAAGLCVMAACSGSDGETSEATEPDVTAPTSTDAPTTTESTTTTTSTTVPDTTTSEPLPVVDTEPPTESTEPPPDTAAPSTTDAPTDTIFDPATLEGEVEQAALANLIAFQECLGQLPDCDAEFATRFAFLEYADGNRRLIEDWNTRGLEIRDNASWVFTVEGVEFNENRTEAIVFTCSTDQSTLVRPLPDGGGDEVVDAADSSTRDRYLLRRIGDAWLVTAKDTDERVDGITEGFCE